MATFALISDPHITIANPETGWTSPPIDTEPTLYAESVELLEAAVETINALPDIDFILCAGDLTKDSEPYNHDRARELLSRFHKPVYCVSGNHDQPRPAKLRPRNMLDPDVVPVTTPEIPQLYGDFGFKDPQRTAYSCDPTPDLHLIALCSAKPDEDRGYISPATLSWLENDLAAQRDPQRETILMLHHSIIDHVPNESVNPGFSWFHVENSPQLKALLRKYNVRLTLSGHLHMQDIKLEDGLYNIATASLAGYPHAFRVMTTRPGAIDIRSHLLRSIPSQPDLQAYSLQSTADSFVGILTGLISGPPFNLSRDRAALAAEKLRPWWPSIARGDESFEFTAEELGDEALAAFVNGFNDVPPADNDVTLEWER